MKYFFIPFLMLSSFCYSEPTIVGDSILNYCHFKNVIDESICGDTTEGVLSRIDLVIEKKPESIILMIGINDLFHKRQIPDVVYTYNKIVQNIINKKIQLTVISVLPVSSNNPYVTFSNLEVLRLNEEIKILSQVYDFKYLERFYDFSDSSCELRGDLSDDGLHLNNCGCGILKDSL